MDHASIVQLAARTTSPIDTFSAGQSDARSEAGSDASAYIAGITAGDDSDMEMYILPPHVRYFLLAFLVTGLF